MAVAPAEALPPLPAAAGWSFDLPVGALIKVSYVDEVMDHERVCVWPSRRGGPGSQRLQDTWWVLSPDGDLWEEDLGGADPLTGPSGALRIGRRGA